MGRWMKTGTLLTLALDGEWCTITMSSNHPYKCCHHSQFISGCMGWVDTPLHKQPRKGITSILTTQYPKDLLWVDGYKLGHFHPLPWMVYNIPWIPITHMGLDTLLNSSMCSYVGLIHHYTSNQARGSYPYWPHNTPRMDHHGWLKTGTLLALAWDSEWCTMSSNHPYRYWYHSQFISRCMCGVDIPLHKQPSKGVKPGHIMLQGWTSMDERKVAHFLLLPNMVCDVPQTLIINADFDTPLNLTVGALVGLIHHCTCNKARRSHPYRPHILQGWTSMDGRKLAHFEPLNLSWMVCDVPWAPTIHTHVDTPPNSSMC